MPQVYSLRPNTHYSMRFTVETKGRYDFMDITAHIADIVQESGVDTGIVSVFVPGSTAGITTMEYEQGIVQDMINVFESWAPEDAEYEHHKRWGDRNGAAHIKSAIIGTSLFIPIDSGDLALGTWQQIVLIDFDEKPRQRTVIVKIQ